MHTHMFKMGGIWETKGGIAYTVKAFNRSDRKKMIGNGWFDSLEDAMALPAEVVEVKEVKQITTSAQLKDHLREQITELGGTFDKRSGIEKLEEQLEVLKDGDTDED